MSIGTGQFCSTLLLVSACAACAPIAETTPPAGKADVIVDEASAEEEAGWKGIASADDLDRILRLDSAWEAALSEARAKGFGAAIEKEGALLDPAIAQPRGAPPPGSYRCRVVKIGSQGKGPAYTAYKPFFCYVEAEDDLLTIVKQTGSERPAGRLYPESDERMIFLGTLGLGDEAEPLPYGEDPERDMAGVMERVAPFRYRLVIPWPRQESKLDVFELVPATQ